MRTSLCAEFLDFAAVHAPRAASAALPRCEPDRCPGLGHVQTLAGVVAERSGATTADVLRRFGTALFEPLLRRYPAFFVGIDSTLDLVTRFEAQVAAEAEKLVPGLGLPRIGVVGRSAAAVEVLYCSPDGLADLAEGLLHGSVRHFTEQLAIDTRPAPDASGHAVLFALRPLASRALDAEGRVATRPAATAQPRAGRARAVGLARTANKGPPTR